jgi:hypothetical protein
MAPLDYAGSNDEDGDIPVLDDNGLLEAAPQTTAPEGKRRKRRTREQIEADETKAAELGEPIKVKRPRRVARNLDGVIQGVKLAHLAVAKQLNDPDIILEDDEATALADAADKLLQYFKVELSGKTGAVIGLIFTAAMIYGPRGFLLVKRYQETGSIVKAD